VNFFASYNLVVTAGGEKCSMVPPETGLSIELGLEQPHVGNNR